MPEGVDEHIWKTAESICHDEGLSKEKDSDRYHKCVQGMYNKIMVKKKSRGKEKG